MDLIPTQNPITAQEYSVYREDMSLVLHRMKTDVTIILVKIQILYLSINVTLRDVQHKEYTS